MGIGSCAQQPEYATRQTKRSGYNWQHHMVLKRQIAELGVHSRV